MKEFVTKNKVVIAGFISAIVLVMQQALANHSTDWKAIGFAALIALLSFIAKEWKGQGVTITGILATLAGSFTTIYQTGTFTWNEFILSSLVAVLTAVSASLAPEKLENSPEDKAYLGRSNL